MQGIQQLPDFVTALPELELPLAGVRGWVVQGREQQVAFLEFSETVDVRDHTHEEQWEFVLAGKVMLRRQGRQEEYGPGDNFFIPAGQTHGAMVYAGYKAMILFNAPDRYRPKD